MINKTFYLIALCCIFSLIAGAQTISIKQFGAVGDGKTLNTEAFIKASNFINKKKKNVTLTIPAGIYIVGEQIPGMGGNYVGSRNMIDLKNCSKIKIVAAKGAIIRYADNLKFGSFNPESKLPYEPNLPFYDKSKAAALGAFILLENCSDIRIENVQADGNMNNLNLGGHWGDTGYQLSHYGILSINNIKVSIVNAYIHHFALDGISVRNDESTPCGIEINNCRFENNARCGLSWVGGRGLTVENTKFAFTGTGKIASSPGCGVDLECDANNPDVDGTFKHCTIENNSGCGLVADSGPSIHITFEDCTFWGIKSWSAWVQKPFYQFNSCRFYGAFVHGYITNNISEATLFNNCEFEDKLYNGQEPFGNYLLESEGRKIMVFNSCSFTANKKKVMWYNGAGLNSNEKAQFKNCRINVKTNAPAVGDFYAVMRKMNIENLSLNLYFDKSKKYYLSEDGNTITNLNRKQYSK